MESAKLDLKDPAFHQNPHPVLKALRETRPVCFDEALGAFVVTGYAPFRSVVSDPRFTQDRNRWKGYRPPSWQRPPSEPGSAAEGRPRHANVRRLMALALDRDYVEACRPLIAQTIDLLLGRARRDGGFDLVRDFATDLPALVFFRTFGVPEQELASLLPLVQRFFRIADPFLTVEQAQVCAAAALELEAHFAPLITQRMRQPSDDVLSRLVAAMAEHGFSSAELQAAIRTLLVAATQTTPHLIASGMLALLRHPEQLRRLRAAEVGVRSALEELLRFEAPSKFLFRAAATSVELSGQRIEEGQALLASPLAANRDAGVFAEPDVLDLSRDASAHVAFGWGRDACLGAALARLEATLAFEALVARLPTARLRGDPGQLRWHESLEVHGLTSLPLEL